MIPFSILVEWPEVTIMWEVEQRPHSDWHRRFQDLLEQVPGVEYASVGRYSARVTFAEHLTGLSAADVPASLVDVIEDPELLYYLDRTITEDNITVAVSFAPEPGVRVQPVTISGISAQMNYTCGSGSCGCKKT